MRFRTVGLFLPLLLAGCGPALSKQDLGQVEYAIPKVAGAEKPYPMPELNPSKSEEPLDKKPLPGPEKPL